MIILQNVKNYFSNHGRLLTRYYHTLKYLKPIQLYGQLRVRIKKHKINSSTAPSRRATPAQWTKAIAKPLQPDAPNKFIFLNQNKDITSSCIWTEPSVDKLWRYNLHYFDFLNADQFFHWQINFIKRWIAENPLGKGDGWEPYALSLRIVNWIKWLLIYKIDDQAIFDHLATQIRFLYDRLEIHLLGNHILANAKALLFAGLFYSDNEAEKWLAKGIKFFARELREQILMDGGHFELSPMYQAILLEDLLDVVNLFKTYKQPIPDDWLTISSKMLNWLKLMCHPDQEIAFFNDATMGVAPNLHELESYRKRIGLPDEVFVPNSLTLLAESGYCRMQCGDAILLADVANIRANYQPGHTHADTLSFELSLDKQRFIVNSGISTYNDNAERLYQRSSHAHNCVIVNKQNSSEVWKSFRVAQRAKVHHVATQNQSQFLLLTANHDGYYRSNKIIHTRTWRMKPHEIVVEDEITGNGMHQLELVFHIHPLFDLKQKNNKCVLFYDQSQKKIATLEISHPIKILDSCYYPGFNLSIPNKKLQVTGEFKLPMEFSTTIKWNS